MRCWKRTKRGEPQPPAGPCCAPTGQLSDCAQFRRPASVLLAGDAPDSAAGEPPCSPVVRCGPASHGTGVHAVADSRGRSRFSHWQRFQPRTSVQALERSDTGARAFGERLRETPIAAATAVTPGRRTRAFVVTGRVIVVAEPPRIDPSICDSLRPCRAHRRCERRVFGPRPRVHRGDASLGATTRYASCVWEHGPCTRSPSASCTRRRAEGTTSPDAPLLLFACTAGARRARTTPLVSMQGVGGRPPHGLCCSLRSSPARRLPSAGEAPNARAAPALRRRHRRAWAVRGGAGR